ncbi:hypothetical protein [Clostridium rectalis]|uniref:hypothetical protein n=1 Tax=Clostridium rectalis TaxID=2040295 RepID=UPI000F63647D|nr:hypothetical protein [Clostridium rectalis]
MNTLSNVLKKSGHDIYENILEIVVVSLLTSIPILPCLFMFLPVGMLYLLLVAMPCFMGAYYAMNIKLNRKPFKYTTVFKGIKKFYLKGLLYGLILGINIFIVSSSWWYYLKIKTVGSFTIAMFQTYFFIMVILSQLYTIPILMTEGIKLSVAMKTSIRLFLDNPIYTVGTFIQILAILILLILTVVSLPLLYFGVLSVLLINIYKNVLSKYKEAEEM